MKLVGILAVSLALASLPSCSPAAPVGNVEALERQAPVTADPNALGNAINARNAVDYSNGRRTRGRGFIGY